MRSKNGKLLPVLRAMDAFTAPAPAEPQPYWAKCECCDGEGGHHYYDRDAWEPCECCEGSGGRWLDANDNEVPAPDEYGYWTRRPDGGLHYHAYDPATEDDELNELADHLIDGGDIPDAPVTCHRCGAPVESDARKVQTAADGTPKLMWWYCTAHLIAGTERLRAAIREQREGDGGEA